MPLRSSSAYKINSGTLPATAAAKIRKTFGHAFAQALAEALTRDNP